MKAAIEVSQRNHLPARAAVIATARSLGALHLAQQRVHLVQRQLAVGARRGVTRHRRQYLFARDLRLRAVAENRKFVQRLDQQRRRIDDGGERGRRAFDFDLAFARRARRQAAFRERALVASENRELQRRHRRPRRSQKRLRRARAIARFEFFV